MVELSNFLLNFPFDLVFQGSSGELFGNCWLLVSILLRLEHDNLNLVIVIFFCFLYLGPGPIFVPFFCWCDRECEL